MIFCLRCNAKAAVPKKQQYVWHPATMRVVKAGAK